MPALIGNERMSPEALEQMRKLGGHWAVYQNHAVDSAGWGHLQFLKIGPDCTFKEPPKRMPDTKVDLGWKYCFVGWVNTETGEIEEAKEDERR